MTKKASSTNGVSVQTKAIEVEAMANSVQAIPQYLNRGPGNQALTLTLASAADLIWPWGMNWRTRDMQLREFWPTEPTLAGAVATIAARNAALSWTLDGPSSTVEAVQDILVGADFGMGWQHFINKLSIDLVTQDNGAFIEVIREQQLTAAQATSLLRNNKPLPPVVGIAHLDAYWCFRTGQPEQPVIYIDPDGGGEHLLGWHNVIAMSEMPSPIKRARGLQYSALTRILRSAQVFRDYGIYKHEKISGRFAKAIHFAGGVSRQDIEDITKRTAEGADNAGLTRYMSPIILAGLDPTKPVSTATLELASLPDGFDYDAELRWYIAQLALTFLEDYQTFAPLPGGGLGTSQQSVVLERKGRGKGVALFAKALTHIFNFWGVLPRNVEFAFDETDSQADKDLADLQATQIANMATMVSSGLMAKEVARQWMADNYVIYDEDYLAMQGESDATSDVTATDEAPVQDANTVQSLVTGNVEAVSDDTPIDATVGEQVATPEQGAPATSDVAAQALNGSQVSSLLEIVALYTANELSRTSATAIIMASFPFLPVPVIERILETRGVAIPEPVVNMPVDTQPTEQVTQPPTINDELKAWSNGVQRNLRTMGLAKARGIGAILDSFESETHGIVEQYMASSSPVTSYRNKFNMAITDAWSEAARAGYADGGGDADELEADDTRSIGDAQAVQIEYAAGLWRDLSKARKDDGDLYPRVALYTQSLRGWYNEWVLRGAGNKALTFRLGDTTSHCETCERLDGVTHGAKWWLKHDLVPQRAGNTNFKCGCWQCQCFLEDSSGEAWTL